MRRAHLREPPCRILLDQPGRLCGRSGGAGGEWQLGRAVRVEQQTMEQMEYRAVTRGQIYRHAERVIGGVGKIGRVQDGADAHGVLLSVTWPSFVLP